MAFPQLNSIRGRLFGMTAVFLVGAAAALSAALISATVLECLVLMARAPGDFKQSIHRANAAFDAFVVDRDPGSLSEFRQHLGAAKAMTSAFTAVLEEQGRTSRPQLASDLQDAVPFTTDGQTRNVVLLVHLLASMSTIRELVEDTSEATRTADRYLGIAAQLELSSVGEREGLMAEVRIVRNGLDRASSSYAEHVTEMASWAIKVVRAVLWGTFLVVFGVCSAVAVTLSRSIVAPVNNTVAFATLVAEGDLSRRLEIPATREAAELARAMNDICDSVGHVVCNVSEGTAAVVSSSEQLAVVSQQIAANAEETASQVAMLSGTSQEVSSRAQEIALSVDHMSQGIADVAQNASEASEVASRAERSARRANTTVEQLGSSSEAIGKITAVIDDIARQTNLLALNATIEAARAGEAGKGFAVVADEVKQLATETARAIEDIQKRIGTIQSDTHGSIGSITEIGEIIQEIASKQAQIAASVEQQSAIAREIRESLQVTSYASAEIAGSLQGVSEATLDTSRGTSRTLEAARELTRTATDLQRLVQHFRC